MSCHWIFRFAAAWLMVLNAMGEDATARGDWSENFVAGDPGNWTFLGEERNELDGAIPLPPSYTGVDYSQMDLRIHSDLVDFTAGRYNAYAVWTRTLDSSGDVMFRGRVSALEGAQDFLGNSLRSNNDIFLATNNGEYLAAIDFHEGVVKLMEHDDGLFRGRLLVPNQVEVIDVASIPDFSPAEAYYLEFTYLGSRLQGHVYSNLDDAPMATVTAHVGGDNSRYGMSSVGVAINDASIGGNGGLGRTSLAAGFDDLVSASIVLPTVSLPISDNFERASVGDLTFAPPTDTMGFVHRGNVPEGEDGGITADGEYLIHDIPSGLPLTLDFHRIDLSGIETLSVSIGVRSWTRQADGFAAEQSFAAYVELYKGDAIIDSFTLFEARGETLDLLDAGFNGEPTVFDALIATSDATAARVVVEAAFASGSDYLYVSSLTASAMDLTNRWIGDANLDGEFDSSDLTQVFQAAKYERDTAAGWSEGDWTGDRRFSSTDLVAAFQGGGYDHGPLPQAVPEASSLLFGITGFLGIAIRRRHRTR